MKGLEGSRLGRYELQYRIAQGGMSEVYLGYDRRVRRRVAVKVLYGSNETFVRRFEREALAIGALAHDHILPIYDFGEQRPWYYLVMPFVEGGTLRDYMFKRGVLTLEEAGSFLEQIAAALQHAHDHGVVHRDVKPSNILLRLDGHAYLVDFGLAKATIESESLTYAGSMMGTPEYMAPEQLNGLNDYRSDIYSLGVILYQMLTGRVPFTADSPVAVSLKHIQQSPPVPSQFNSMISPALEEVMLKALAKKADERYQEATMVATAYKQVIQQEYEQQKKVLTPAGELQEQEVPLTPSAQEARDTSPDNLEKTFAFTVSTYKMPSFSLDYKISPLPLPKEIRRRRIPSRLFTIVTALFLFSLLLPIGLLWRAATVSQPAGKSRTPDIQAQQQRTARVLAQANANAQATMAAQAQVHLPVSFSSSIGAGKLLYYDAMTRINSGWLHDGKQCYFSPEGYHVSVRVAHAAGWCYTNQQQFTNVVITAQYQLVRGDFVGLVFRLNPYRQTFYILEVNSHSQYRFQRAAGRDPTRWLTLIDWTSSNAILSGYGRTNVLLVVAVANKFLFYVNQQLLVSTNADLTYPSGLIGFLVGGDSIGGTEAIFSDIGVFQR